LIWLWPPLRLKPSCQKQPFDCVFGSLFFSKKQREELQIDLFFSYEIVQSSAVRFFGFFGFVDFSLSA
jgi:hypothetical protein